MRIGADAIVLDGEGRVLLGHRRDRDEWNLPGGAVDAGEAPWAAAARECREECGIAVLVSRLVAVVVRSGPDELILDFLATSSDDSPPRPDGVETDAVGWFAVDALPATVFRPQAERLRRLARDWSAPVLLLSE